MKKILEHNKICATMRNIPLEKTLGYAEAVYRGGVRMLEVAMSLNSIVRQVETTKEQFGGQVHVETGTVTTSERCRIAQEAGVQLFLMPSATVGTMGFCREYDIPFLSGVFTSTNVAVCLGYGYSIMKLFPVGDMPSSYIESLRGPFNGAEYVVAGGVTTDNIEHFLSNGFIRMRIGSSLMPREYVKNSQRGQASQYIGEIVRRVNDSDV